MNEENKKEPDLVGGLRKLTEIVELQHSNLSRTTETQHRILALVEKLSERVHTNAEEATHRDEELQRNINFIIQQQAQFTADMQQLRETQARSEQKWERTEGGIRALLSIAEIHQQESAELRQAQAEAQARTDARLVETGERVDALVNTVERLISERRNGGRKAAEGDDE